MLESENVSILKRIIQYVKEDIFLPRNICKIAKQTVIMKLFKFKT